MASARDRSRTPAPQSSQVGGQRTFGTVKQFNGEWGFLVAEGVDGDIFCHLKDTPQFIGPPLQPGENVQFEVVQSMGSKQGRNNGLQAVNVQRKAGMRQKAPLATFVQQGQAGRVKQEDERVIGTLKSIRNGMGFCLVEGVEGDVLLGQRSLNESGIDLMTMQVGDSLTFDLATGPKGFHASNIQAVSTGGRVTGTLKTIRNGMGFCVVQGISGDVLLGQRSLSESGVDLATMQVGDTLTFEVSESSKGYHATSIRRASHAHHWREMSTSSKGYHPTNMITARPSPAAQRAIGTLKSIRGGMGFCAVEGVPGDVLLGQRSLDESGIDLGTMQVGDSFTFDLATGPKGFHASNIQPVSTGGRVTGTLKTIRNSMAFCTVQGVSGDVLLGERSLNESGVDLTTLQVGDTLTFEMSTSSKGYHATNILTDQPSLAGKRAIGTLKTIRNDMGFCSVDGVLGDVLLGSKSLNESGINLATMQVGDSLTFELVVGAKGYHAVDIRLPGEESLSADGASYFRKTQTKGPRRALRPASKN
eukprot:CAMPEP_0180713528 /NCGR_PEP_ID=MMETSP1038_2-20121128/11947_1 /TAXON_ID=632150 /ORGANISM="Azadinium spinosum, Strain 3D9" /LENGTH=531 /DNA_ID=CAMNT_0022745853 /DNA_START=15 /DNA_END=1611 /DNA_ORIENTATION=-